MGPDRKHYCHRSQEEKPDNLRSHKPLNQQYYYEDNEHGGQVGAMIENDFSGNNNLTEFLLHKSEI